ncbi:Hypothetical predicted protein [Octopus vulgaris]|uniref:Uncharacterized protein n=1 Tax=Octopus vulgaris TaxID=6645 RepID=A0AA36B314_OCTVU|nr:Hypothetical predicted protein [Octopus vulgaris]
MSKEAVIRQEKRDEKDKIYLMYVTDVCVRSKPIIHCIPTLSSRQRIIVPNTMRCEEFGYESPPYRKL